MPSDKITIFIRDEKGPRPRPPIRNTLLLGKVVVTVVRIDTLHETGHLILVFETFRRGRNIETKRRRRCRERENVERRCFGHIVKQPQRIVSWCVTHRICSL